MQLLTARAAVVRTFPGSTFNQYSLQVGLQHQSHYRGDLTPRPSIYSSIDKLCARARSSGLSTRLVKLKVTFKNTTLIFMPCHQRNAYPIYSRP